MVKKKQQKEARIGKPFWVCEFLFQLHFLWSFSPSQSLFFKLNPIPDQVIFFHLWWIFALKMEFCHSSKKNTPLFHSHYFPKQTISNETKTRPWEEKTQIFEIIPPCRNTKCCELSLIENFRRKSLLKMPKSCLPW